MRYLPRSPDIAFAADAIYGVVYYPALVILAFDTVFQLGGSVSGRWMATTSSSWYLGRLLVSRMIIHVPYLFLKMRPADRQMRPLYMVHHAIVIVVYGAGVLREKAHYWGALSALCETTNIFCTIIEIFACCENPKEARQTWWTLYWWNSLGFGLTYCAFRLVLFPVMFYWFLRDLMVFPDNTWQVMGPVELYIYPFAVLLIFVLSVMWAGPVIKGTQKTVFGVGLKKVEEKKTIDVQTVSEVATEVATHLTRSVSLEAANLALSGEAVSVDDHRKFS